MYTNRVTNDSNALHTHLANEYLTDDSSITIFEKGWMHLFNIYLLLTVWEYKNKIL